MEMEKDIWGGSWSPEIESRVANSIWEEKYRVSFELIDSSEERISFLKKLIRKNEILATRYYKQNNKQKALDHLRIRNKLRDQTILLAKMQGMTLNDDQNKLLGVN